MKDKVAVIWDLDGTLMDTAELHFRAWQELARQIDKPFNRADFASTFGWRNPELIPKIFGNHYTPAEIEEIGNRKELLYRDQAKLGVELLPGAATLLAGLQQAGFVQAVGSSAPRANLALILEITGSQSYFQATVGMEDTPRGKPDPEVFLLAAKKLQIPPERCLVFEDAPVGVQAAKAGGMRCIAVTFAAHHPRETLAAAGADAIVDSLEEVSPADVRRLL